MWTITKHEHSAYLHCFYKHISIKKALKTVCLYISVYKQKSIFHYQGKKKMVSERRVLCHGILTQNFISQAFKPDNSTYLFLCLLYIVMMRNNSLLSKSKQFSCYSIIFIFSQSKFLRSLLSFYECTHTIHLASNLILTSVTNEDFLWVQNASKPQQKRQLFMPEKVQNLIPPRIM